MQTSRPSPEVDPVTIATRPLRGLFDDRDDFDGPVSAWTGLYGESEFIANVLTYSRGYTTGEENLNR